MDLQTLLGSISSPMDSKGPDNARISQHMPNVAKSRQQAESIANMPPAFSTNQALDLSTSPAEGSTLPTQTAPAPSHATHLYLPRKTVNEDDYFGDAHLSRANHHSNGNPSLPEIYSLVPLPGPQPIEQVSKYNPTPVQMAEMKRRSECLPPVTCSHPNLVVSRGHEELRPPSKKIYRDDMDLFFNVFAKWVSLCTLSRLYRSTCHFRRSQELTYPRLSKLISILKPQNVCTMSSPSSKLRWISRIAILFLHLSAMPHRTDSISVA